MLLYVSKLSRIFELKRITKCNFVLVDSLNWRRNGCDSVPNHQPYDCLLNRLFRRRSKNISKLRVTGLCVGTSPGIGELVTGHNGHKPKRPQPKRPQTETATNRNGHRPKRPQTETATNRNGHKPERPQTRKATNRNGHRPERPQTETPTSVFTPHINCHQNKYDGESPIGNDDIHANFVLSANCVRNFIPG